MTGRCFDDPAKIAEQSELMAIKAEQGCDACIYAMKYRCRLNETQLSGKEYCHRWEVKDVVDGERKRVTG